MSRPDKTQSGDLPRLNKFLARAGFGSRRAVEAFITAGRVTLNGETVRDLGRRIDPARDQVTVDGKPATQPRDYRVYAFHKPLGVVSTLRSQGGQASLPAYRQQADLPERFMPVGRLDSESTGLLLWTDDGQLNQDLCRPHLGLWKTYEVDLNDELPPQQVPNLTDGKLEIDGRRLRPCRLAYRSGGTTRQWIMQLQEGRRRQIRRMFRLVGLKVTRLHRIEIGTVALGLLRPGDFRRLTLVEVQNLRQAVAAGKKPAPSSGSKRA